MTEYNPCNSCWFNLGNCNGVGLLAICCGTWCCKGPIMEQHNPTCCYCFELSGIGCNLFCLGCVCCHPPWFNGYTQKYFGQQGLPYNNQNPNPMLYPTPSPNPNFVPQFQEPHHHHHHGLNQAPPTTQQNVYQDIQFVQTPTPYVRDPQANNAF